MRMSELALVLALFCLGLVGRVITLQQSPGEMFRVRLNANGQFVDPHGRIRLFHGFNSIKKAFPWYDDQILNSTRLRLYQEWGFDVVRLGTMWAGAQPAETGFNETYLALTKNVVQNLARFGIFSLLDMHQDVLSSKFTTYDGIPLWLLEKFPKTSEKLAFPFPLKPNETYFWTDYYLSYDVVHAYQSLYSTEIGLQSWSAFWTKIVREFKELQAVIGYELINEPWVGNFYNDPPLLLPGYAGRKNLLPAYDFLVQNIRALDNETLIFYEPVTLGAYLPTTGSFGTGFDRVPGGEAQRHLSVLSYHYYCFVLTTPNPANNYTIEDRFLCDNLFANQLFKSVKGNVEKTGGGSFLTEFGGCEPDGNPASVNTIECDSVLSLADQHFQSYTYWDSNFFDVDGHVLQHVVNTFARAYPRAIQGQPVSYQFDRVSARMTLVYRVNLGIRAPTEVFIPLTVHYSGVKGFSNTTIPPMITKFNHTNFIFSLLPPSTMRQGTLITLIIYRA